MPVKKAFPNRERKLPNKEHLLPSLPPSSSVVPSTDVTEKYRTAVFSELSKKAQPLHFSKGFQYHYIMNKQHEKSTMKQKTATQKRWTSDKT